MCELWAVTNCIGFHVIKLLQTIITTDLIITITDDLPDVYTVEEAVDKLGFGAFQVFMSIFAGAIWVKFKHSFLRNSYVWCNIAL